MTDDLTAIRREIARLRQGRPRTAVRYPPTLRRRITALVQQRRRRRGGVTAVARDLDMPRWTLNLWSRISAPPRVRAVALMADPPESPEPPRARPVLITADGVRIEGASLEELTTLLRALR